MCDTVERDGEWICFDETESVTIGLDAEPGRLRKFDSYSTSLEQKTHKHFIWADVHCSKRHVMNTNYYAGNTQGNGERV